MSTDEHGGGGRRRKIRLDRSAYRRGRVFFVTISTLGRYRWFERHLALAKRMQDTLVETAAERESQLFAWCIMPDHLHLLVEDANLMEFVRLVKGRMVPAARACEPSRRLWQRSFYDHALRDEESLESVARYIFYNPVEEGLVARPIEYPWSGSVVWPDWREHDWVTNTAET